MPEQTSGSRRQPETTVSLAAILPADRYVVGPTIGVGAFGEVMAARDLLLDREVAVKLVPTPAEDVGAVGELLREARTASAAGRSAVMVYDVVAGRGGIAIIMELLKRGSLVRTVRAGVARSIAVDVAVNAVGSMASVHRAGILHLDLHPGNLLMREDGTVAVSDFGLAQFGRTAGLSRGGHELNWTAPELLGYGVVSPQADVYALGLILKWIGRRAGVDFGPVIDRSTVDDPAARHRDAGELLADLRRSVGASRGAE